MSAISLKSITGITSITTPAGADNQLTLHTNNTTEAVKLDGAGNFHFHNHLNITGVSTASNFKTGSTNVHSTGVELANINTGGGTATFGGGITVAGAIDANGDLDVDGHTNLDNLNVAGVTTFSGDVVFSGDGDNITFDKSTDDLIFNDGTKAIFGTSSDGVQIYHASNNSFINDTGTGSLILDGSKIRLRLNGSTQLETDTNGIIATGTAHRFQSGTSGDCELIIEADTDNNAETDNPRILFRQDGGNDWSAIGTNDNVLEISNSVGSGGIALKTAGTNGYQNAVQRFKVESSGNIAIGGVFNASRKVHIKDSGQIRLENTSTGGWAGLEWLVSSGTNNYDAYMGLQDSNGLFFIDNNSNGIDFCITQGGKVFIGADSTDFSDVGTFLNLRNNTYGGRIGFSNNTASAGATLMEQFSYWGTNKVAGFIAFGGTDTTNKDDGELAFYTRQSGSAVTEALRIKDDGEIRIRGVKSGNAVSNVVVTFDILNSNGDSKKAEIKAIRTADISSELIFSTTASHSFGERMRISDDGKIGIGDDDPVVQLHVKGGGHSHATLNVHTSIEDTTSYAANVGGLQVFEGRYNSANSPAVFSAIHGGKENATDGNYAGYLRFLTRAQGAMPSERVRIASNGFMGVNTTNPQTELNVIGSISAGRNVAKELGTIINISSNHNAPRSGGNVISGQKNYETGSNDWLAAGGSRVNANLTIDLGTAISCDRFVIYNQNEYDHSNREVKNFTLEGSNDNSSWTTVLDDDCGCSHGHEPNPGFSFRIPAGNIYGVDDDEGLSYRYWRFTMKTFHGSDSYGGVTELELYQTGTSTNGEHVGSEVTTSSLSAGDVHTERLDGLKMITSSKGLNIHTGEDASDTWELTETSITTNGSYIDKSTIRHKRGVMAVSSSYNSGDLFIRIDNLYNLPGNAWWTFGVLILSDEVAGTLAGHHSYVTSINIHGLGSWSSISKHDIRGTMTVSVSSHGSNFIELFINVNDSSRGPCTVICNGGTFDPPRISFH